MSAFFQDTSAYCFQALAKESEKIYYYLYMFEKGTTINRCYFIFMSAFVLPLL